MSRRLSHNVKILGWASLLNDVASEMIFPLLPQFLLGVLGGNRLVLGVIEGVADTTASLVKLASGGWSDRAGARKPFVVFGYLIAAVARPVIALLSAPWQLAGVRVADRLGKGIRTSPRDALIADSTLPEQRGWAFGFQRGMDHLGAALGPVLAAAFLWLYPGQLRTLFLLTIVPGLAVVALLVFGLQEKKGTVPICRNGPKAGTDAQRWSSHKWGLSPFSGGGGVVLSLAPLNRSFRWYLVTLVVFTLGNSSDAFLLVRAGELGVPTVMLPLLWCAFHVAKSGGNMIAGRVVDRLGPRPMILLGWLFYAAIYLLFGLATQAWHAWALFLAYAIFYALTEPAEKTLVANFVGREHLGLAYGWFNFAVGLSALPASVIFGAWYEGVGPLAAFAWGAALAVVATMMLGLIRR